MPTSQNQQDTAGTSDRIPNKDGKVQHQPGAAGTSGSDTSSEGASTGTADDDAGQQDDHPICDPGFGSN